MKWTQYGLTLSLLTESEIEMVRYWRNHPDVSRFMEYRQYISADMQQQWFAGINNTKNFFFIIEHQTIPIGLISTTNIDWQGKSAECGIFVWNEKAAGSHVPVFAVLAMLNFVFWVLRLQTTYIKVHRENQKAKRYNQALGYQLIADDKNLTSDFQLYQLTKAVFIQKTTILRQLGSKTYGDKAVLQLENTPHDSSVNQLLKESSTDFDKPFELSVNYL